MNPLRLKPIIKGIRWGGTRLKSRLGKEIGAATDAAESWEVVDHGDDQSVVLSGEHKGKTLTQLVANHSQELFGREGLKQFPLLIKFLDATDRLSLQVHPNDEEAKEFDLTENGKTEAWVILDATPESRIWLGLKRGVTKKELEIAIEEGRFEETVHVVTPKAGDCYFVPAGTVHAIGEGVLLAEVQQSSDLTFRMYDWGRVGADGQSRPLHVAESLRCIDFARGPVKAVAPETVLSGDVQAEQLIECEQFRIERYRSVFPHQMPRIERFRILMVLKGALEYECAGPPESLSLGDTLLIPASSPPLHLTPLEESIWLQIEQP